MCISCFKVSVSWQGCLELYLSGWIVYCTTREKSLFINNYQTGTLPLKLGIYLLMTCTRFPIIISQFSRISVPHPISLKYLILHTHLQVCFPPVFLHVPLEGKQQPDQSLESGIICTLLGMNKPGSKPQLSIWPSKIHLVSIVLILISWEKVPQKE